MIHRSFECAGADGLSMHDVSIQRDMVNQVIEYLKG
jgi:hypothetical protein